MVFFASIPLLLGILYIKVYFSPSLRTFYLFFLQESVCSGPFLLSSLPVVLHHQLQEDRDTVLFISTNQGFSAPG